MRITTNIAVKSVILFHAFFCPALDELVSVRALRKRLEGRLGGYTRVILVYKAPPSTRRQPNPVGPIPTDRGVLGLGGI